MEMKLALTQRQSEPEEEMVQVKCEHCNGRGRELIWACFHCNGFGYTMEFPTEENNEEK